MGHSSIDTTMRYYTAVPPELLKDASEAIGELLFGSSGLPTPVTLPSDTAELERLKAELEEKLLQI